MQTQTWISEKKSFVTENCLTSDFNRWTCRISHQGRDRNDVSIGNEWHTNCFPFYRHWEKIPRKNVQWFMSSLTVTFSLTTKFYNNDFSQCTSHPIKNKRRDGRWKKYEVGNWIFAKWSDCAMWLHTQSDIRIQFRHWYIAINLALYW